MNSGGEDRKEGGRGWLRWILISRGGHRVMFLENHYRTLDSEGLLNV